MELAPIALFVYNRPEHTKRTIESLARNSLAKESELFIFSDGARTKEDEVKIQAIRKYIKNLTGFKRIEIIEKEKNDGLAKSIINGVTQLVNQHGKVIVLEDDIISSPFFLTFMNEALNLYQREDKVMHINGYFFPNNEKLPDTFFYNQALCWGWGTWKRAWNMFIENNLYKNLDDLIKAVREKLDWRQKMYLKNALSQLYANKNGMLRTWAARWQAFIASREGFCLTPHLSYTFNSGHDGSGEHYMRSNIFATEIVREYRPLEKVEMKESVRAAKYSNNFLKKVRGPFLRRVWRKLIN